MFKSVLKDFQEKAVLVLNRIGPYCNYIHANVSLIGFSFQYGVILPKCKQHLLSSKYIDFCADGTQFARSFTFLLPLREKNS